MKLKPIASNMTELHLDNGTIVLFSYETPVAASGINGLQVTKTKYSVTTSKHINKWVGYKPNLEKCGVEQSVLDNLVKTNQNEG